MRSLSHSVCIQGRANDGRNPGSTFAGLWGTEVWVFGSPLQNTKIFFGIVQFKHPHSRYPKTSLLANRVARYGCLWRHPRTQTIFFCIVQFKHPHPRYPKTSLLAYGAQRCGCFRRHLRSQIFFCIVLFKHDHPRYPKTLLLAYRVQRYGCFGRHPRTQRIFFGILQFKTPPS